MRNGKPRRPVPVFALIAPEPCTTLSAVAGDRLFLELSAFLEEEHELFFLSLSLQTCSW